MKQKIAVALVIGALLSGCYTGGDRAVQREPWESRCPPVQAQDFPFGSECQRNEWHERLSPPSNNYYIDPRTLPVHPVPQQSDMSPYIPGVSR